MSMDFQFPYFLHLLILLPSFFFIYLLLLKRSTHPRLPPGKRGWLSIKEAWEFYVHTKYGNPQKFVFDRMSKYSEEVFTTSLVGMNMAVFCGESGNKFVFSTGNKVLNVWWPSSIKKLIPGANKTSTKSDPTTLRNLVSAFVKPDALEHYVSMMDSMAKQQMDTTWLPHKEVKVVPLANNFAFAVACRLFFSVEDAELVARLEHHFHHVTAGLISVPVNIPGTAFNRAMKGAKIIREELISIIKQRKKETAATCMDMLAWMLVAENENGEIMSEAVIANKIIGVLLGSHDTTTTTITFVVKFLADYPHIYQKVFQEQIEIANVKSKGELLNWNDVRKMNYSWCVACEVFRMMPFDIGVFREAKMDFTYAGFTIPKGYKTALSGSSTFKNPRYFPDPEKFDPSRYEGEGPKPYTFMPFGGGASICPGREYARIQILVFMHNLVTKFKLEKVDSHDKIAYGFPFPIPSNGLPVRLHPHCN